MNTTAWLIVAFLAGVGTGATLRESYEILIGRHQPMDMLKRALHVRIPVLTAALVVSLMLNMAVGVIVILNDRDRDRDVACQVEFNQLTAEARDARIGPTESSTDAQIQDVEQDLTYQRGLLETVTSQDRTVDELAGIIRDRIASGEDYLGTLRKVQKVRVENEYPPADYCVGGKR